MPACACVCLRARVFVYACVGQSGKANFDKESKETSPIVRYHACICVYWCMYV